jgi:hypothetical protein
MMTTSVSIMSVSRRSDQLVVGVIPGLRFQRAPE